MQLKALRLLVRLLRAEIKRLQEAKERGGDPTLEAWSFVHERLRYRRKQLKIVKAMVKAYKKQEDYEAKWPEGFEEDND